MSNAVMSPFYAPCPYEVGDILTTRNATPPSERWPGTVWSAIETFLLGASATHPAGQTAGAEVHSHGMGNAYGRLAIIASNGFTAAYTRKTVPLHTEITAFIGGPGASAPVVNTETDRGLMLGGTTDQASSMPPFTAVYIWERTA